MVFRKTLFGRKIELDNLQAFLVLLIVANFLFVSFLLFTHPIPFYQYSDSANHYKMIELIKKDFKYIGYLDYPKGFHLASALLSYVIPVGAAINLVSVAGIALLLFFSYKLSFLVSGDKNVSLLSALFVSAFNIFVSVNSIATPVPQTIGMALFVAGAYFFLKKDWLKAGIALGVYSWMHGSFLLLLGLFFLFGLYELLRESRIERLVQFAKSLGVMLVFYIPLRVLLTVFSSGSEKFAFDPKISFYEEMVSPLSFFLLNPSITFPPLIMVLALIGIYFLREKIFSETKHFFLFLAFIIPLIFSQLYWITTIQSPLFLGSRALFFLLYPLAFFSAKGVLELFGWLGRKLKCNEGITLKAAAIFALVLLAFSSHSLYLRFNGMASFSEDVLELVYFLQGEPVDAVVASEHSGTPLILMGLKRSASPRNFWLVMVEKDASKRLDKEKIDYILLPGDWKNPQLIEHTRIVFENESAILLKVDESIELKKTDSLDEAVLSLVTFFNIVYNTEKMFPFYSPYVLSFLAEDTKEEACVSIYEGVFLLENCPHAVNFRVTGKKSDLMEAFNSFDKDYVKLKFGLLYRKGRVEFEPTKMPLAEEDVRYLSCLGSWSTQSPYSKPNQWIANWFCYNLK